MQQSNRCDDLPCCPLLSPLYSLTIAREAAKMQKLQWKFFFPSAKNEQHWPGQYWWLRCWICPRCHLQWALRGWLCPLCPNFLLVDWALPRAVAGIKEECFLVVTGLLFCLALDMCNRCPMKKKQKSGLRSTLGKVLLLEYFSKSAPCHEKIHG